MVPPDLLKKHIGPPIEETARMLLKADDDLLICQFIDEYRMIMEKTFCDGLRLLPGAHWILKNLRTIGVQTAIFTNKQQKQAERVCEAAGLDVLVECILGTREVMQCLRKPDLRFSEKILQQLHADQKTTAMVGDSSIDMETGSTARLYATYGIATGTHCAEELLHCQHVPTAVYPDLWKFGKDVFSFFKE
jgi:phosphoglycolate phosphatase-like HAD superfamily hydrolase